MSADWHGGERRFPTTHWSLVARAGKDRAEARGEALGDLLVRYLPALRAHLICAKGIAPDRADDLVQGFVADKILEKDLISRADRDLGKFRTFLLAALGHFVINQYRDQHAKKRAPRDRAVLSIKDHDGLGRSEASPSTAYEVAWARGVIGEALRRMQLECQESNRTDVWGIFEGRVLGPTLEGSEPVDYDTLIRRFGFQSPSQVSNVLVTAKRMYARVLRSVVGEYAQSSEEIESEINELKQILASSL
ncbi:MAG: sigma-70 family RNA polymerase sigma factor [Planctomycetes bacterium]|nr:sigma-70 family RNA polymerase sigma factor [Planctomycetota bacterium]